MGGKGLLYLDSSALVKLVLPEKESLALLGVLPNWTGWVTSEISTVEVIRAAQRASADAAVVNRARQVMACVHLIRLDASVLQTAASLPPPTLRTLDAIHLSSALSLADDLGGLAAYDQRLSEAARKAGMRVLTP